MATKKRAASKTQTSEVLTRLQGNMRRLQKDAEALLGRTRKQASNLISRDQKRALDRLFSQAQRLRTDLEKRAQRASRDVESRAERFLSTLEKEAGKRIAPLLKRLDLPSRQEIHNLSRRIGQLERRVRSLRPGQSDPSEPADDTHASPQTEPHSS